MGWQGLCAPLLMARLSPAAMDGYALPRTNAAATSRGNRDGRAAQRTVQLHSLVPGGPSDRGDRLDVGDAVSAAFVRLSHGSRAGFGLQRTLQGDGMPP